MITDDIKNIDNYKEIPSQVADFLKTLTPQTPTGRYEINENAYVNISEYETKPVEDCKFEAHKRYIDIQMLLSGSEELDLLSIDGMKISKEYDEQNDYMFLTSENTPDTLILTPFKFTLIYPHEAHRPQMNLGDKSNQVKKAVAKILI